MGGQDADGNWWSNDGDKFPTEDMAKQHDEWLHNKDIREYNEKLTNDYYQRQFADNSNSSSNYGSSPSSDNSPGNYHSDSSTSYSKSRQGSVGKAVAGIAIALIVIIVMGAIIGGVSSIMSKPKPVTIPIVPQNTAQQNPVTYTVSVQVLPPSTLSSDGLQVVVTPDVATFSTMGFVKLSAFTSGGNPPYTVKIFVNGNLVDTRYDRAYGYEPSVGNGITRGLNEIYYYIPQGAGKQIVSFVVYDSTNVSSQDSMLITVNTS